ncbi:MAG: toprim domain-containing protein [Mucilaginibacter sp.]|uniref:toprim domain-containing protein n=1 Tax=Mucilaginibacter sp. TaxID=1882438 RepID=UPI0032638A25
MNIEQAKTIPISEILAKLNFKPTRQTGHNAYYFSPIRNEKTASFHVNSLKNCWYDHGIGQGGDGINLVCLYLKSQGEDDTVYDALRWIRNMVGTIPAVAAIQQIASPDKDKSIRLKSADTVNKIALIRYLENRGIALHIAAKHLKQVRIHNQNTGKHFYALGFKNEKRGYELRNSFFKGCVGSKTVSFIRGQPTKSKTDEVHLFEGFMDYLTFLTIQEGHQHQEDVIVLNSTACIKTAISYIKQYGYKLACTWMDNDQAGDTATALLADFFKTEENLLHKPMNSVYQGYKDLNAWHMHNLNLCLEVVWRF